MITITLVIYLYCKHKHIRTIISKLILNRAKEVEAKTSMEIDNSECGTLVYIGITLTLLSMAITILLHYRKSKFCRGYRFLKHCKDCIVHLRCATLYTNKTLQNIRKSPSIQITGTLKSEDIRLNKNYLWDTLEIKWDKIKLLFNGNEIELPQPVMI